MASFDPYHKWLAIPPKEQPPNHYRLLGLADFESDADVIEGAAEQRTIYLRTFQTGPNAELAERLLNEVSAARVCLLTAEDKAEYDKQLQVGAEHIRLKDVTTATPERVIPEQEQSRPLANEDEVAVPVKPVVAKDSPTQERDWTFATAKLPNDKDRRLVEPEQLAPLDQGPLGYSPDELVPTADQATPGGQASGKREKPLWQEPWAIPATGGGIVVLLLLMMWLTSGGNPSSVGDKPAGPAGSEPPVQEVKSPSPAIAPFDTQAAEKHQQQWASHLETPVALTNSIGMKLKLIPPGKFMRGYTGHAQSHEVQITSSFYMGTYEVTQAQYEQVMGSNPSNFKGPQNPVEMVSWHDAVEFCRKLSAMPAEKSAGRLYRLPTDAQWEYACRAGTTTKYSFGDEDQRFGNYAWYVDNSGTKVIDAFALLKSNKSGTPEWRKSFANLIEENDCRTHAIGRKQANPWGLYDIHGNVWEWCQDWYGAYPSGLVSDPLGPASGTGRVHRGGCWASSGADQCMSAHRGPISSHTRAGTLGFRIAMSSTAAAEKMAAEEAIAQTVRTLTGHTDVVTSVAFSPDGKRIASAGVDKTVKVWSVDTGREILSLEGHTGVVMSVVFSPDGKRIVSAGIDKTANVWDLESGQLTLTIKAHSGHVRSVSFSSDGKRIVSGSLDRTAKVWDSTTGQEMLTFKDHSTGVFTVAFSPNGKWIASGGGSGTMKMWNSESGQEVLTVKAHSKAVYSMAFSPDGKQLLTGSYDNTAKLWDAKTGQEICSLRGHAGWVTAAFSSDGKRIISSGTKTVKLWDSSTTHELLALIGHTLPSNSVAFSPDGKRIVSCSEDKTVKIWDISSLAP